MTLPRTRRALLEALAVAVAYYVAARLGLALQLPGTNASAVWPPSGIALAGMLLLGPHLWPGIAAGAFLANFLTLPGPVPAATAAIIAAGNTLEQLAAWALIRRFSGSANPFDRARHTLGFVGATAIAGLIAATMGVTTLYLVGVIAGETYRSAWTTWFVGDTAGMILLAPAIYAWGRRPQLDLSFARGCELAVLVVLTLVTGELIFGGWGTMQVALSRPYQPILLWAAFRFGQRETSTLAVIASVVATIHVWAAIAIPSAAVGPASALSVLFVGQSASTEEWLTALQFFLSGTAVVALVVAAAVAERDASRRELAESEQRVRSINQNLVEQRVRERTAMVEATNRQLEGHIRERLRVELELRASLQEKETLLREIHHRVKNNLQVVSSLLYLEADESRDAHTGQVLAAAQHRVRSMALMHDELYRSGSYAEVDFRQYIEQLSSYLAQSYPLAARRIAIDMQAIDPVVLDADTAIPCGLIYTELLTNAFKHGYGKDRAGTITVRVRLSDGACRLTVADDGAGIRPRGTESEPSTLGLRLVDLLARQLDGVFTLAPTDSGTTAVLEFPMRRLAAV